MTTTKLSKEDLWHSVLGGAALSTGGGGSAISYERFSQAVDPIFDEGLEPKMIDPMDLQDDESIVMPTGIGGGISREDQELYGPPLLRQFAYRDIAFREMDRVFPLLDWAKKPEEDISLAAIERLKEIKRGEKYTAYLLDEIGPGLYRHALKGAQWDIPVVDADSAGHRAVPEMTQASFNVKQLPATPAVIVTRWGDMVVYERSLSWQRLEDVSRAIARISGGSNSLIMSFTGKEIREAAVHGGFSRTIKIGKAIASAGKNPIDNIVEATNGYKIFEGEILAHTTEGKGAYTIGNGWITGTGEFKGEMFRFWYKNENHISWLDGDPYVTSPDTFTVIDSETGVGMSNFRGDVWSLGKKVSVLGVKCEDIWRTERGLRIFNPKHFGFDIKYRPIEEIMESR